MDGSSKSAWRSSVALRIGAVTADPVANELHRDAQIVRVRPLLMDVLLRLASAPSEVVTREQLIEDVWPRRMVNDEVLSRAIGELRTLLGDDAKQPRYVETLPKIGYRLIAPVSAVAPDTATDAGAAATARPETADAAFARATDSPGDPDGSSGTGAPPVIQPRITLADRVRANPLRSFAIALVAIASAIGMAAMLGPWLRPATVSQLASQLAHAESFAADDDPEFGPRFSPDGKRVIYAQVRGRESTLVLRDIAGNILDRIAKPGALMLAPVFLPDGKRIVFWQRMADDCGIVERELATGNEREIIGCTATPRTVTDVAPDGKSLAVSLRPRPQHPFAIARVSIADGTLEMLTKPQPGDGDDARPRFSPDGLRLVFSRGNNSHTRIWMLDTAKPDSARPLNVPEGLDYGAAWMGRDGPLLVAADWVGFRALVRVDIEAGQVDLAGGRGARFPDISPAGDIVFEAATYRANLLLTDAVDPGAKTESLWPSSRYTNQPRFSPDGTEVVFVSNREGAESLYVGKLGGPARRLTASTEFRHVRPHWTADGKRLYAVRSPVSARQEGPHQAVLLDPATGAAEVLSSLGESVKEVMPLGDGGLLIAEQSASAMRLSRVVAGRFDRLPLPLVNEFQVDGDDLIYLQPDLQVVTRCSLSSLKCEPLSIKIADVDRYHWHLGRGVLWYRATSASGSQLQRLDLATGETRAFDFVPTGVGTSLASSPDGTKLIITREAPTVVDLMLARKPSLLR